LRDIIVANCLEMECKNCGTEFEGNFCNCCGQKATTRRLTYKTLAESLMHGFLHVDKGVLYTLKMLFVNPGKIVADYISCKRVSYFQPFPLLIILSTIYGLFKHLLSPEKASHVNLASHIHADKIYMDTLNFIINHIVENYAFVNIFIIPPFIFAVMIAFRKVGSKNYNFVEYLFGGAYLSSLYIVISIVFLCLESILKNVTFLSGWEDYEFLAYFFITMRLFYQLFEGGIWGTTKRTIYAYLLYVLFLLIYILLGVGLLVLAIMAWNGIHSLFA